ncbi:MAG: polysaccharide export protein [Candidatus Brocadiaceae bacterium]|nr:polysaccharide export protein [Candidatus Brocadiaceae bacterium]
MGFCIILRRFKLSTFKFCTICSIILFIVGGCIFSKDISTNVSNSGIEDIKPIAFSEFTLGPGDTIEINVWKNEELNRKALIGPSGGFSYPFLGDIQVTGMSIFQLRQIITKGIAEYFVNPQVTINILSNQSKKIFVLGEVNRPGAFQMPGPTNIIEAIAWANGFTHDAKERKVLLIRGDIKEPELKAINLNTALKKGDTTQNLFLRPGDVVYVPATTFASAERFFRRIQSIITPFVTLEYGLAIAPMVEDTLNTSGREKNQITIPITPP